MEDPLSLSSILDEQLEWVPDIDDPSRNGEYEEPPEHAGRPPISSVLAEPEWAIILLANASRTVDLIRDHLNYRGNSATLSRIRHGEIKSKLGFIYTHLLIVGRRRDHPKPRRATRWMGFA